MCINSRLWVAGRATGAPRIDRRRLLRGVAAAGFAAGTSSFPAIAQQMNTQQPSDDQASLAERLTRYAIGLRYDDLPEDVIRLAKRAILDTLGCAFGGYSAQPSRIAIKLASDISSKQ